MSDFTIYYSNGKTYKGPPQDAPGWDVQIIVQPEERVGWASVHASDYYVWDHEQWRGADLTGLMDYLSNPGWNKVLIGRWIPAAEFNEVYRRALKDRDERKSGFVAGERQPIGAVE